MPEGSDIPLVDKTVDIAVISYGSSLTINHKMLSLRDCIEQLCYDFLEEKEAGWELNEGACIEDVVYSSYEF